MNKLLFSHQLVFSEVFSYVKAAGAQCGSDAMAGMRSRVTAQFFVIVIVWKNMKKQNSLPRSGGEWNK